MPTSSMVSAIPKKTKNNHWQCIGEGNDIEGCIVVVVVLVVVVSSDSSSKVHMPTSSMVSVIPKNTQK